MYRNGFFCGRIDAGIEKVLARTDSNTADSNSSHIVGIGLGGAPG